MYKALFFKQKTAGFKSVWGVKASPQKHLDGYILPLGWERELRKRNIEFREIQVVV